MHRSCKALFGLVGDAALLVDVAKFAGSVLIGALITNWKHVRWLSDESNSITAT